LSRALQATARDRRRILERHAQAADQAAGHDDEFRRAAQLALDCGGDQACAETAPLWRGHCFECLEASLDTPIVGRFSAYAAPYLRFQPAPALYCHSLFLGRKVRDVPDFRWADADIDAVIGATRYPPPQ
jgi:hypothetical protein